MGYLQVFSATETHQVGDDTTYYPHTGYSILSGSGTMLTYVVNHIGTTDESPTVIRVPPGRYQIVAEANGYGRVTVPVVIRPGRTTTIHLERNWKPVPATDGTVVRLPHGEAVGWRSDAGVTQ